MWKGFSETLRDLGRPDLRKEKFIAELKGAKDPRQTLQQGNWGFNKLFDLFEPQGEQGITFLNDETVDFLNKFMTKLFTQEDFTEDDYSKLRESIKRDGGKVFIYNRWMSRYKENQSQLTPKEYSKFCTVFKILFETVNFHLL